MVRRSEKAGTRSCLLCSKILGSAGVCPNILSFEVYIWKLVSYTVPWGVSRPESIREGSEPISSDLTTYFIAEDGSSEEETAVLQS